MTRWTPMLAALALGACAQAQTYDTARLEYDANAQDVRRTFQEATQTLPFAAGTVSVVAPDGDAMRTFTLVPCRGGSAVCAEGLNGRAGVRTQGAEFTQISGAYPGRVFYLSPGGDGYMAVPGGYLPISWE